MRRSRSMDCTVVTPKVRKEDVNTSISLTIDNASRITNVLKLTNTLGSNLSNIPSSSNSLEDCVNHPIHLPFGNDQFAPILGYGDLVQGNIMIKRGNDLLTGSRGSDLYTISLQETSSPTPICFLAKASPTQAWLRHRRLSHINFNTINLLSKEDIVNGLPKLKYVKDKLSSSCELSKLKKSTFKTKTVPSSKGRLNLLHMDLCGLMRIESINGKKYWVSDDEPEAPEEAPQFPKQAPPSPDYVPGPEHPPSSDYVHGPEYPEYLVPSDDEVPIEDQPLPDDASPTALSPSYVADFDPSEEDPEENLEEYPAEHPANRGDDDEEEDEEEEEHLASADSTTLPTIDPILSTEDTEAFETDESAPTPPLPRLRKAGISVRLSPPMTTSMEALIAEYAAAPTLPSPPPSPLTPLSSPLPRFPHHH
ncbi:retrovirus-related pol polyprotein from transposon TNT 1-94 [Tanacetum coccineum]